uniref:THAP-type domain-containing protein n=1 Tax=Lygus hesperus TaxID=30085 RepID=A0A146L0W7_LYGHE
MPSSCFAPGCKTGYRSEVKKLKAEGKKTPCMFRPPKDKIEEWNRRIPRSDRSLGEKDVLCALHFVPEDIITTWEHTGPDGKKAIIEREKPCLLPTAVPCIFPNIPSYLSNPIKKRKAPTKREPTIQKRCNRERSPQQDGVPDGETAPLPTVDPEFPDFPMSPSNLPNDPSPPETCIYNVQPDISSIKLPGTMWGVHTSPELTIFCHLDALRQADKCVEFRQENPDPTVTLRGKVVMVEQGIKNKDDVEVMLQNVHAIRLCSGASPGKFSSACSTQLHAENPTPSRTNTTRCKECQKYRDTLQKRQRRANARATRAVPKMTPLARCTQQKRRLQKKVQKLETVLGETMERYECLNDS